MSDSKSSDIVRPFAEDGPLGPLKPWQKDHYPFRAESARCCLDDIVVIRSHYPGHGEDEKWQAGPFLPLFFRTDTATTDKFAWRRDVLQVECEHMVSYHDRYCCSVVQKWLFSKVCKGAIMHLCYLMFSRDALAYAAPVGDDVSQEELDRLTHEEDKRRYDQYIDLLKSNGAPIKPGLKCELLCMSANRQVKNLHEAIGAVKTILTEIFVTLQFCKAVIHVKCPSGLTLGFGLFGRNFSFSSSHLGKRLIPVGTQIMVPSIEHFLFHKDQHRYYDTGVHGPMTIHGDYAYYPQPPIVSWVTMRSIRIAVILAMRRTGFLYSNVVRMFDSMLYHAINGGHVGIIFAYGPEPFYVVSHISILREFRCPTPEKKSLWCDIVSVHNREISPVATDMIPFGRHEKCNCDCKCACFATLCLCGCQEGCCRGNGGLTREVLAARAAATHTHGPQAATASGGPSRKRPRTE